MTFRLLFFVLGHYGFVALLAAFAYLIGARLTQRVSYHSGSEKFSFCTGLGLGVIAYLVLAAGLLHLLTRGVMLALFGIIAVILAPSWRELGTETARLWQSLSAKWRLLYGIAFVLIAPFLLLPLFPPTQWDATSYHLAAAKIYVNSQAVVFTPYLRYPVFPQTNEMLFTLALLLYDDVAAQVVEFLMMLMVAIALYAWGRRAFNSRAGLLAAALWLSNPRVLWLGTAAYIDMGLTMFVMLAAYAFLNWWRCRSAPWLLVSAALFGFAAGTKYLALFPLLGFSLFLLYLGVRERSLRAFLVFATVAIVIASPWYVRNAYYTGNPIWPYLGSTLGYGTWSPEDAAGQITEQTSYGAGRGPVALLLLPWNVIVHGSVFADLDFSLSPAYLLLLPFCLLVAFRDAYLRILLVAAGLYTLFWFGTIQVLRYLIPAAPVLSLAAAAALEKCVFRFRRAQGPETARALTGALCVLLLVAGWAWAPAPGSMHSISPIPRHFPPTKAADRRPYLKASVPLYPAIEFLNQLKGNSYALYAITGANMAYFADGQFMGDWFGPAWYGPFWDHFSQPEKLYQELRRLKADHLLIAESGVFDDALTAHVLAPVSLAVHLKLIYADSSALLFEVHERPVQPALGPELLQDGGFEQWADRAPGAWAAGEEPFIDGTGANSHTGKAAVRSDGNNSLRQRVAVESGSLYVLRNFSRATKPAQFTRLQLHWLDGEESQVGAEWRIFSAETDWHSHAMAANAPANAVWVDVYASAHEGQVWLDDFSLVKLTYK